MLFNKLFFPIFVICLICEDIGLVRHTAKMANFWRFFASCIFSEPRAAFSDLHSNFALRPHHVWKCDRHPICDG